MKKRMPIWGVGPKIMAPTFVYLAVAGIATYLWPSMFLVQAVPYLFFLVPGVVLLAIGLPMLVVAVVSVKGAYKKDELATKGIFGIVRNPIYAAWIVFNIPGLVLLLRSWPMFFAPFLAYGLFKMLIGKEEKYLQERFGQAYLDYRLQVNEIVSMKAFFRLCARHKVWTIAVSLCSVGGFVVGILQWVYPDFWRKPSPPSFASVSTPVPSHDSAPSPPTYPAPTSPPASSHNSASTPLPSLAPISPPASSRASVVMPAPTPPSTWQPSDGVYDAKQFFEMQDSSFKGYGYSKFKEQWENRPVVWKLYVAEFQLSGEKASSIIFTPEKDSKPSLHPRLVYIYRRSVPDSLLPVFDQLRRGDAVTVEGVVENISARAPDLKPTKIRTP